MNLEQLQVNYLREEELRVTFGGIFDPIVDYIVISDILQTVERQALMDMILNSIYH